MAESEDRGTFCGNESEIKIRMLHIPSLEATIIFFIILAILFRWQVLELFFNSNTWAVVAMLICFTMVSGHTWNKMRNPAFSKKTNEGPVLISSGQRRQFLAESYIVAVLNGAVVLGMILSIEGAGGVRGTGVGRRKRRRLLMMAGFGLMFAAFTVLLATFKIKRPWYPYSL